MQKEFLNIAAHELRTPIQPILGLAEVLRFGKKKIKGQQDLLLDTIIRNSKRLKQHTEDILDVTRIESQSLNLNKEQFNLNDLITLIIENHRSQIEKEKYNVNLSYSKSEKNDFLMVDADRGRITQVISNLLSNAIKFTPREGGIVSVIAKEKKNDNDINSQQVIVSVKDNGEGIHPEILPRLFSKFTTKSFSGIGLGLFICKSIVESHGGKIWAENNADGKGATFSFSLPVD